MSARTRLRLTAAMALCAFAFSAVVTRPVFADGETPPPDPAPAAESQDPPTEPVEPAAEEPAEQEAPPADPVEPLVSGETLPPGEEAPAPAPDSQPASEEPAEPAPVEESAPQEEESAAEALAQVPDGTELVVLGEDGEALPLASEEAEQTILMGDPMWCPAGVTPGGVGCSISYPNLKALVDDVGVGLFPAANGVIWITGYITNGFAVDSSGANITFNGTLNPTWDTWNDFTLTLKGGWLGCTPTCVTTIDTSDASVFNKTISIVNWNANVTLSDITINGASGTGLTVSTTKDISLTRVQANNNTSDGADLSNLSGVGKIAVSEGQFNWNDGAYGLYAASNGTITLKNVTANENTPNGYGAYLENNSSPVKSGVTLSGVNTFNGNKWDGLVVYTKGVILANDVTASANGTALGGGGVNFYNAYSDSAAGVTLTGTNIFTDNYGTGLTVNSRGAIKINNLIANGNDGNGYGAYLDNSMAVTAQPVTLTGSSQLKYNKYYGLYVVSKGSISLNNITANGTLNGNGLYVDQCVWNGSSCDGSASGGVKLTGANAFNDNSNYGIYVRSVGAQALNNVTANGNGLPGFGYGAYLDNCYWAGSACANTSPRDVTLTGVNSFDNNKSGGLSVDSLGAIKLNSVSADGTVSGYGAMLNNNYAGAAGGVTVSGSNTFNANFYSGLDVKSYGAISLSNVKAVGNGLTSGFGSGAFLDNCIWVVSACTTAAQPVTVSGVNDFSGNKNTGLYITSTGAIKLNSVTANDSLSGNGAQLNTTFNHATINSVTLSGTNFFNGNFFSGLDIDADGRILLNNVTAAGNHGIGLNAVNTGSGSLAPRDIVMTGANFFEDNWFDGLYLVSYGAISLSNVTVLGNGHLGPGGYGAYLDNSGGTMPRGITLGGANTFSGNYTSGLFVTSLGAIKINNLTANNNGVPWGNGAALTNANTGAVGGVTLTGTNTFNNNLWEGLVVSSYGAVAINNLRANDNGDSSSREGAEINNSGADPLFPKPVTLTGASQFNGNAGSGLLVSSLGLITASNLTANGSQNGSGVVLHNDNFASPLPTAGVTLTGVNTFSANWYNGLEVGSYGVISLLTTKITANGNGLSLSSGSGVVLANEAAAVPRNVVLSGMNTFNDNYGGGLQITSDGAITAGNLTANGNTNGPGANLSNSGAGGTGGVTLTGANTFDGNYTVGLQVNSLGAITISNLTASDNTHGMGANLANNSGAGGITLSGTNAFNGNYDTGLNINSKGAITLNNVISNQNGLSSGFGYGAALYNDTAGTPQAVKLTGANTFNGNQSGGLNVYSHGAITINNLSASYNLSGGGAVLYNNTVGSAGDVILTGVNTFTENVGTGLQIGSLGNVNLTKVTADGNSGDGLYTNPTGTITLTCGSFTGNTGYGWRLTSLAGITLKGVVSAGNGSGDTWFGSAPVIVRTCPLP